MILAEIKRYLRLHSQASLENIALHCDAEPDAVRGMLEQWIRKGRVERRLANESCGSGCSKCEPARMEIYLWLDADGPAGGPVKHEHVGCGE